MVLVTWCTPVLCLHCLVALASQLLAEFNNVCHRSTRVVDYGVTSLYDLSYSLWIELWWRAGFISGYSHVVWPPSVPLWIQSWWWCVIISERSCLVSGIQLIVYIFIIWLSVRILMLLLSPGGMVDIIHVVTERFS